MKFKPITFGVSIREIDNGFLVVMSGTECFVNEEVFCSNLIKAGAEINKMLVDVEKKWEQLKAEREESRKEFLESQKEEQ